MNNTITANNVEFKVTLSPIDGMVFLAAPTSLHYQTWNKCVRDLGISVELGDWKRGYIGTYDIEKVKVLLNVETA